MAHRVAPEAEAELDEIWRYIARESGSVETARAVVSAITADVRERSLEAPDTYLKRASTTSGSGRRLLVGRVCTYARFWPSVAVVRTSFRLTSVALPPEPKRCQ